MKRKLLLLFFALTFVNNLSAQNPLVKQWDYRFGGDSIDRLQSFQHTFDGGYILGGESDSDSSGDKTESVRGEMDYWIVKLDSLGIKQWDKRFGGTKGELFQSLQQTSDRGYILGGWSFSDSSGDKTQPNWDSTLNTCDYWIIKIDSLGIKQWDKRFGGTKSDCLYSLKQTNDGGYILGGWSKSGMNGDKTEPNRDTLCIPNCTADFWIVKTDSLGNKEWDKTFGGMIEDELFSLQQTIDEGYILGGVSQSGVGGDKTQNTWGNSIDYWIVKIDSLGIKQWDKDFGGTSYDGLFSMNQTSDSGYILAGYSNSGISGDKTQANWDPSLNTSDYWIIKIDSLGIKQWDKSFGGTNNDFLHSIQQTTKGSFLLAGTSTSPISGDKTENNLGYSQSWIVKIDSLGMKQWDKTILTTAVDLQGLAIQTQNNCYLIANYTSADTGGYKTQLNWGYTDYWIIKFCDTTSTTSINQISNSQSQFSIYPNPTNLMLNLSLNKKENIVVTNLVGEIVLQKTAEGKIELDVSFLSSGIYFIKAGNEVRKFVKE